MTKIEHITRSTETSFIQLALIVCLSRGLPKNIETQVLTTCLSLYEVFSKNKKSMELAPLTHFLHCF